MYNYITTLLLQMDVVTRGNTPRLQVWPFLKFPTRDGFGSPATSKSGIVWFCM